MAQIQRLLKVVGHRVSIAAGLEEGQGQVVMGLAGGLAIVQVEGIVVLDDGPFGVSEHLQKRKGARGREKKVRDDTQYQPSNRYCRRLSNGTMNTYHLCLSSNSMSFNLCLVVNVALQCR